MSTYTLVQLYNPESSGSSGIQEFWYPYTKKAGVLDLITFPGATSTTTGSEGLVPSASSGSVQRYLRVDGTWAIPPTGSGGGTDTTYKFKLNATWSGDTTDGNDLSNGGIYAPTTGGSQWALLTGGTGNIPSWWTPNGSNSALLKYNPTNGWLLDSSSYVVEQSNFFMYQNGTSGNPGGFGNLKNGEDIVFRAGNNIAITGSTSGTHHIITFNAAGGGSTPSIAPGTGLSLTNSTMSLEAANSNTIGGVRVIGSYNVSAGTNYSSIGIRFPLALSANEGNRGFVGIPLAAAGTDGLLRVAADANPGTGYQNTDYLTAVPVFYGTITNLKIYKDKGIIEEDITYDNYDDGNDFTGHYVNVRDVFNGIIRDEESLHLLWWLIEYWKDGWKLPPWISKQ